MVKNPSEIKNKIKRKEILLRRKIEKSKEKWVKSDVKGEVLTIEKKRVLK